MQKKLTITSLASYVVQVAQRTHLETRPRQTEPYGVSVGLQRREGEERV